ncbi:hypothetical protein [Paenibacillus tyrfis]|uniref:hypothetical protein n=1 Tax=Paenibacillus tyrfis TaxID=1501230 RepID=UPI000B58788D|nr:hypothetical protein [Paenibacillus tyrfis]
MGNQNGKKRIINSFILKDNICPICGGSVYIDDGYGSNDMQEYCEVDRNHYRLFMNLFVTTIVVDGKKFEALRSTSWVKLRFLG